LIPKSDFSLSTNFINPDIPYNPTGYYTKKSKIQIRNYNLLSTECKSFANKGNSPANKGKASSHESNIFENNSRKFIKIRFLDHLFPTKDLIHFIEDRELTDKQGKDYQKRGLK
jgi:FAD synthase